MAVIRRQVQTRALPGARRTAAETSLSTGAGLEEARARKFGVIGDVGDALTRTGTRLYARAVDEEREKANEVALLKASNALGAWKTRRLYDPENGALTRKGEAAQGLPEEVLPEWETFVGEIEQGLGNDEQKAAFARLRGQQTQQLDLELRRHVFGEMQTFRANELKSAVDLGTDEAIRAANDPTLVGLSLQRVENQIRTNAPRLGLGKAAIEAQVADTRDKVHRGVIDNLLAQERAQDARDYFTEAKSQIAADRVDEVEKALTEGSVRAASQKEADRILAEGGTLTEQLKKAKDLDPKLRDEVENRLEHAAQIQDRADREALEGSMKSAYDILDKTGNVNRIPAAQWASFSGATRSAMRSYAEQKTQGTPVKTDLPTYYGLMRQAMTDPTTFSNYNLLEKRHVLGETEFKQLTSLQLSIKNGDTTAAEKDLGGFRTANQVVDDAVVGLGINPNANVDKEPAQANAVASLRRLVDNRIAALQATTGKKATSADVQSIVDQLLSVQVEGKGTWAGLFTDAPFYDTKKRLIETTIDDIPAEQKKLIEQALTQRRVPISDATILSTYQDAVARGLVK